MRSVCTADTCDRLFLTHKVSGFQHKKGLDLFACLFVLIFHQGFAVCCLSQTHPEATHKTTLYNHLWWGEAPGTYYMVHISHSGVLNDILQMSDNVVFSFIRLKSLLKSIFTKSEGLSKENTAKCFFSSKDKQNYFESSSGFQKRVLSDNNIKFFCYTDWIWCYILWKQPRWCQALQTAAVSEPWPK